jgi:hypothetical protein
MCVKAMLVTEVSLGDVADSTVSLCSFVIATVACDTPWYLAPPLSQISGLILNQFLQGRT